jgi:hypothetical protein
MYSETGFIKEVLVFVKMPINATCCSWLRGSSALNPILCTGSAPKTSHILARPSKVPNMKPENSQGEGLQQG